MKRTNTHPLILFGVIIAVGALILSGCMPKAPLNSSKPAPAAQSIAAPLGAVNLQLGQVLITGVIEQISNGELVINNMIFRTDSLTDLPASLLPGMLARVVAINLPDNTRYAIEVAAVNTTDSKVVPNNPAINKPGTQDNNSSEFEFSGIVENINGNDWMISSYSVQLDPSVLPNGITVGSTVHVDGLLVNGVLVVKEIKLDVNHKHETASGSLSAHNFTSTPEPDDNPKATPTIGNDYPTPSSSEVSDQAEPSLSSTQPSGGTENSDSENISTPASSQNGGDSSHDNTGNKHNSNHGSDDGGSNQHGDGGSSSGHGGD